MKRPYKTFRIVSFETIYGTEEYIVHSIFPKIDVFQLKGPRDVRTLQETKLLFKEKVGFWGLVKLSITVAYYKIK